MKIILSLLLLQLLTSTLIKGQDTQMDLTKDTEQSLEVTQPEDEKEELLKLLEVCNGLTEQDKTDLLTLHDECSEILKKANDQIKVLNEQHKDLLEKFSMELANIAQDADAELDQE